MDDDGDDDDAKRMRVVDAGPRVESEWKLEVGVDAKVEGCSGIVAIGVVTVKADRGSRGLVWVAVVLRRGGGSRDETLGGALGGDVLDAFQVRDDDDDDDDEDEDDDG